MKVELERHFGTKPGGKQVELPQYRVRGDGNVIGYIAWHDGAPLCLIQHFGPIEVKEIEEKVQELKGNMVGGTSMVPDPAKLTPEVMMTDQQRAEAEEQQGDGVTADDLE